MKLVAGFGWLMAAFGAFASLMVLTSLGEQDAGDATIRFIACVALAVTGVVIARLARRGAAQLAIEEAERLILSSARAHRGRVTATEVASETPVPLAQATEILEALSRRGLCRMSVAEAGILVFEFPELEPADGDDARADSLARRDDAAQGFRAVPPARPTSDRS